jgi:trigger factor
MKKKSLLLGTCLCLMLSLAACSKSKTSEGDNVTPTAGEVASGGAITSGGAIDAGNLPSTDSDVVVTLGQYKGIEVTLTSSEVTDEEVQQQLDSFNQSYGVPIKVTDRTDVKDGDTVNIDYEGKIDGVAFEGGTATGSALTIGSGQFIDGFEDGLIGKNVGETLDVPATFPADYDNADVAGKEAIFTVTINYIQSGEYEPLTDAVVAANDTNGNKTVADYEAYIRESIKTSKETSAQQKKEIDIVTKAIENATFTNLEQSEFDTQAASMTEYYTNTATQYGIDLATYVYYFFGGMSIEDFNKELAKAAEFNVKQKYLLDAVVAEEKLELTETEYTDMLTQYMTDYEYTDAEKFVTDFGGKETVEKSMILDKAMDLILDSAVVTE